MNLKPQDSPIKQSIYISVEDQEDFFRNLGFVEIPESIQKHSDCYVFLAKRCAELVEKQNVTRQESERLKTENLELKQKIAEIEKQFEKISSEVDNESLSESPEILEVEKKYDEANRLYLQEVAKVDTLQADIKALAQKVPGEWERLREKFSKLYKEELTIPEVQNMYVIYCHNHAGKFAGKHAGKPFPFPDLLNFSRKHNVLKIADGEIERPESEA